jgi:acyl-CoA hydrolase
LGRQAAPSTQRVTVVVIALVRIVAKLADGIVTTPRAEADLVVTEHGIADLRGRTLAERARVLVAVSDPAFRAELEQASEQLV